MQKFLTWVGVTGVGEKVPTMNVLNLATRFNFAVFGVLASKLTRRSRRVRWLKEIASATTPKSCPNLELHICGLRRPRFYAADSWLSRVLVGDWTFLEELESTWSLFSGVQLNLRDYITEKRLPDCFYDGLKSNLRGRRLILQLGRFDHPLIDQCRVAGIENLGVLFDQSGGKGKLPAAWPTANPCFSCGYVGGLGPTTLHRELPRIAIAAQGASRVWIDAQSAFVNWDADAIKAVGKYMGICAPWVCDSSGISGTGGLNVYDADAGV